jgi:hypothetical protein
MAAVKAPCFDYEAATKGKDKDYGLTAGEIRPIWEYAKKRYLDNGLSYEETIDALHRETGAPPRFFAEVFAGPKSARVKNVDIYRKEDARREAKERARQFILDANNLGMYKFLYKMGQLPRAILTAFHGGVFPVTHGGGLLLLPEAWVSFAKGARISWGTIHWGPLGRERARAFYEHERLRLYSEPDYAQWRQNGLRIGVDERAKGILSGWLAATPNWSSYSWLGLMRMRYEFANHMLRQSKWKTPEEMKSIMQNIAEIANHATGVSNIQLLGPVISKGAFAPQLTSSKILRVTHDPYVTVRTMSRMLFKNQPTSIGERVAARQRIQHAAEFLGFWAAGLMLNQGLLSATGSNQKINWLNPTKSDWLRFKTGTGLVLATRGPEEFLRLYGQLASVAWTHNKRQIHGKNPWDEWMDKLSQVALYKGSPGFQTTGELLAGVDMFGRPLPPIVQAGRKMVGLPERKPRPGKPQYSLMEYVGVHSPIFLSGGSKEIWEQLRERGLNQADSEALLSAGLVVALEFAGFGGYHEKPETGGIPTRRGHKKYHGSL